MKTIHPTSLTLRRITTRAATVAALGTILVAAPANAQNGTGADSRTPSGTRHPDRDPAPAGETVRVTRATNFLGTDVIASDNRKVGDIVDYYFDSSARPHLKYVVVMTGGFLGYGGDARAIPASAITTEGDSARLNVSGEEYWNAPVLPQNRDRYLSNPDNLNRLAQVFNVSDEASRQTGGQSGSTRGESTLVSFMALTNEDVYDRDGQRIGRLEDTWLSLDANRAPYAEVSAPPRSPFQVQPRQRYAIPLNQLEMVSSDVHDGYRFDITEEELRNADTIGEAEGVQLLKSGEVGRAILRVRVSQR